MFLAPDGGEAEIANTAAEFLADVMSIDRLQGPHPRDLNEGLRRAVAENGWFGLMLPEEAGGSGLSAVEHALFFREVGRQCGPVDVLAQSCAVAAFAETSLCNALLQGEEGVAIAVAEGDGVRLLGAPFARYALQVTRQGATLLVLAEATPNERSALDPANSMRLIEGGAVKVVAQTQGDATWRLGQLGAAAMLVGIAEAALDLIVDYAKLRETFGRKIGSYQAVRHPCANMALRVEAARCELWFAAAALKEGRDDASVHLDAAKHLANQAALANADGNIQLHGGIGITSEHAAPAMLKHALLLSRLFGSKRALLRQLLHAQTVS